ncbi:hypothetical protein [Draconibacterium orientale]|uniref:hypothetical protein n=1 Tax=Draconibacterium orientale TaxID=1168034 RepID=UPI002A0A70E5|nr:hypothetical protein [Draconibacterium orientale]
MKRFLFASLFVLIATIGFAQPFFDLGVKAGVHYSNMSFEGDNDLSSDAITKMHWGAFGRVGVNRLYVQPEVYFSKKVAIYLSMPYLVVSIIKTLMCQFFWDTNW